MELKKKRLVVLRLSGARPPIASNFLNRRDRPRPLKGKSQYDQKGQHAWLTGLVGESEEAETLKNEAVMRSY